MKYQAIYNNNKMQIRELNDIILNNRSPYEIKHNMLDGVTIFNTIDECIKDLNTYGKPVLLPNNETIIPDKINYPNYHNSLKRVLFPLIEA